ncbi:MAG: hypothetical protein ACAH83_06185 [Alphaproteobacteria bacterium]
MSDISTPPPETPKPKKQLLENLLVKSLLSLVAWLGPLPLSVVLLKFWFTHGAPPDQSGSDPFNAIRKVVSSPTGSTVEGLMLLSLVPSIIMLVILHRSLPKRVFAILGLLVIATGELLLLLEVTH